MNLEKINVNDYKVDKYDYNLKLNELVKEVRYKDDTSKWMLENVGPDVVSLDEMLTPPAGFTESSSFDPEDNYNF